MRIKPIALNALYVPYNTKKQDRHTSQNII